MKINRLKNKSLWKYYAFAAILIISLLYAMNRHEAIAIYDAEWYMTIADGVVDGNGIHLSLFPKTFRGCLLPLCLQVLNHSFWGIETGWKLLTCIMVACIFGFMLPEIITESGIDSCKKFCGGIVAACAFIYVWGDFLIYPLSDLVATFFLVLGAWIERRILSKITKRRFELIIFSILTGASFYISYNCRATFLYGVIVLLIWGAFRIEKDRNAVIVLSMLLVGTIIVMLPQCIVNKNCEGAFSPRVYTENYSEYTTAKNLQMQQVVWGLKWPRYETYMGDDEAYPSSGVYFIDQTGVSLIEKELITEDDFTLKKWVKVLIKHPLDMIAIYTRHVINAMTPVWNHIYIKDIYDINAIMIALSIVAWLISIASISCSVHNGKADINANVICVAMVFPCLMQLMGAVEIRFILPLYMLCYSYIGMIDYKELFGYLKKKIIIVIVLAVLTMSMWTSIISSTLADNAENCFIMNERVTYIQ